MEGLAHYHRKEIALLSQIGTPVGEEIFNDLIRAERSLGPAQPIERESSTTNHGSFSLKISMIAGTRRRGFEGLRDVVTEHRRKWASAHLPAYLRARWQSEITAAGRAYNLLVQDKDGRVPTLKQFARAAALPTNHWFGGNVCGLYAAIREKCPATPKQAKLMPGSVIGFAKRLYELLPSQPFNFPDGGDASRYRAGYIEEIANLGIKYIQMEEGLGRPPEMKELGEKFPYYSKAMTENVDEAWRTFVAAVKDARESTTQKLQSVKAPINPGAERNHDFLANVESKVPDSTTQATQARQVGDSISDQEDKQLVQPGKKTWWQRLIGKQ